MKGHNYSGICRKCGKIHIHPLGGKQLKGIKKTPHSEETKKRISEARKGIPAWNKGLTKEIDERVASYGLSVSKSWKQEERQKDKISSGNRLREARNKYILEHPEHQFEASNSRSIESKLSSIKLAQEASRLPEVREKAKKTLHNRYEKGELIHPNSGKKMSEETKSKIRNKLLEREPIYENTSIEIKIQEYLSSIGIKFEKQYPFFITFIDVAIPDKKIAIYADGCYWHGCSICKISEQVKQRNRDVIITTYLEKSGWKVIRLWEHDINSESFNKIMSSILMENGLIG